jgi:hypothetical protein
MSCIDIVNDLSKSVKKTNNELIENMIKSDVKYTDVCLIPNISYGNYYDSLKEKWEKTINDFINKGDICSSNIQNILLMYEITQNISNIDPNAKIDPEKMKDMILDKAFDTVINSIVGQASDNFVMDPDMIVTVKNLGKTLGKNVNVNLLIYFHIY